MATVEIEDSDEFPKCPHCEKELKKISKQQIGSLQVHIVYFCPECKKILNIVSEVYGY